MPVLPTGIESISNLPVPPSFPSLITFPGWIYVLNFALGLRVSKGQKDIVLHPALHGQHPRSWSHIAVDTKYIKTSDKGKSTLPQFQLLKALFMAVCGTGKID